jgi:hypothetical protein
MKKCVYTLKHAQLLQVCHLFINTDSLMLKYIYVFKQLHIFTKYSICIYVFNISNFYINSLAFLTTF